MKRLIATAVAAAGIFAGSAAIAADDPIAVRQALMKNSGASIGVLGKMAKGEMDFDALAAGLAIRALHSTSYAFGHYFPKGSETGMDTRAKPEIWSNMGDFEAKLAAFQSATGAAVAAMPKSQADLGPLLGPIGGACGACHKAYQVPKS